MTNRVSQLVGALNRLYVAAPTGLECNSFHHSKGEFHSHSEPCKPAAEYVEALAQARAALTAAKAGGWLPIETAPKDGTVVILGRAEDDASVVTTGHWQEAEEDGVDYMGADAGFVDEHYQEFKPGRSFGSPSYRYAPTQPTAWQPLPNPPKEQSAGGPGSVDAVANPLSPT